MLNAKNSNSCNLPNILEQKGKIKIKVTFHERKILISFHIISIEPLSRNDKIKPTD